MDQLDLIDIYRTFHSKAINFTFLSSAHGTFSRIDHIMGHKSSLGKFKKIEIIPSIFSDHNAVRLDVNYRSKTIKNSNIWRLNNTLLNNQQITEEIKKRNQNMHRNKWKPSVVDVSIFLEFVDSWFLKKSLHCVSCRILREIKTRCIILHIIMYNVLYIIDTLYYTIYTWFLSHKSHSLSPLLRTCFINLKKQLYEWNSHSVKFIVL